MVANALAGSTAAASSASGLTAGDQAFMANWEGRRGGRVPSVGIARKHYDEGGVVGGLGGISAGVNPIQQNQYQQFANMPTEKLQELAARIPPNNPQGQLIQRALKQKQAMPQTNQQPQSGIAAPGQTSSLAQLPSLANPQGYAPGGRIHMDAGGNPDDPYGTGNYNAAQDWSNYGLANNLDAHADRDPDQLYDRLDPTRLSWSMSKDTKPVGPIAFKGFAADDKPTGISADSNGHYSGRYSDFGEEYGPPSGGSSTVTGPTKVSGPPPAPSSAKKTSASSATTPAPSGIAAGSLPSSDSAPAKGSDAANMALMAAGFGMMSGKSPHALENIGEGGLRGLQEYGSVKNAEKQAQQLANEADWHKNQLAIESRKADQQGEYQRGELGNSAARIAMEREHYSNTDNNGTWFSGNGPDENGNTVAGSYHAPKQGGQPQFYPGLTMNGINRRGPASDFDINKQAQITTDKELINGTITKAQYAQTLQQHTQELQRQLQQNGQPPAGNQRPAGSSPATAKDYINLYGKPQKPDQNNNGE